MAKLTSNEIPWNPTAEGSHSRRGINLMRQGAGFETEVADFLTQITNPAPQSGSVPPIREDATASPMPSPSPSAYEEARRIVALPLPTGQARPIRWNWLTWFLLSVAGLALACLVDSFVKKTTPVVSQVLQVPPAADSAVALPPVSPPLARAPESRGAAAPGNFSRPVEGQPAEPADAQVSLPKCWPAMPSEAAEALAGQPQRPEAGSNATPIVGLDMNYFFESLSPYGTWLNIAGYGQCWRPTVTLLNRGWRPYADKGRWVQTEEGWFWQSDYTWGTIAFHYGRWFPDSNHGWCWWPDTVWAPSWVTWRHNGSYCGWAPLPPFSCWSCSAGLTYRGNPVSADFSFGLEADHYCFVPWTGFWSHDPRQNLVATTQAQQIYGSTIVVNNLVKGNEETPIHGGIPVDLVASHSGSEIRRGSIRDVPMATGRALVRTIVRQENSLSGVDRQMPLKGSINEGIAPLVPLTEKITARQDQELSDGARASAGDAPGKVEGARSQRSRRASPPENPAPSTMAAIQSPDPRRLTETAAKTFEHKDAGSPDVEKQGGSTWLVAPKLSRPGAPTAVTCGTEAVPKSPQTGPTIFWQGGAPNQGGAQSARSPSSARRPQFSASRQTATAPRPVAQPILVEARAFNPMPSWAERVSAASSHPLYSKGFAPATGRILILSPSRPPFQSQPFVGLSLSRQATLSSLAGFRSTPPYPGCGAGLNRFSAGRGAVIRLSGGQRSDRSSRR